MSYKPFRIVGKPFSFSPQSIIVTFTSCMQVLFYIYIFIFLWPKSLVTFSSCSYTVNIIGFSLPFSSAQFFCFLIFFYLMLIRNVYFTFIQFVNKFYHVLLFLYRFLWTIFVELFDAFRFALLANLSIRRFWRILSFIFHTSFAWICRFSFIKRLLSSSHWCFPKVRILYFSSSFPGDFLLSYHRFWAPFCTHCPYKRIFVSTN